VGGELARSFVCSFARSQHPTQLDGVVDDDTVRYDMMTTIEKVCLYRMMT